MLHFFLINHNSKCSSNVILDIFGIDFILRVCMGKYPKKVTSGVKSILGKKDSCLYMIKTSDSISELPSKERMLERPTNRRPLQKDHKSKRIVNEGAIEQLTLETTRQEISRLVQVNLNLKINPNDINEKNVDRYVKALIDYSRNSGKVSRFEDYKNYLTHLSSIIKHELKYQLNLLKNVSLKSASNVFISKIDAEIWLSSLEKALKITYGTEKPVVEFRAKNILLNLKKSSHTSDFNSMLKIAVALIKGDISHNQKMIIPIMKNKNMKTPEDVLTEEKTVSPFVNSWHVAEFISVIFRKIGDHSFDINQESLDNMFHKITLLQMEIQEGRYQRLDALLKKALDSSLGCNYDYCKTIPCPTLSFFLEEALDVLMDSCARRSPTVVM